MEKSRFTAVYLFIFFRVRKKRREQQRRRKTHRNLLSARFVRPRLGVLALVAPVLLSAVHNNMATRISPAIILL